MKQEYIVTRQGQEVVLYRGLLDEAHQQGLKRVSTTLIQIPHPDNGNTAIVQAEVETERGTFSGIGDASPGNAGHGNGTHFLGVAETRAKARALSDAVNAGMVSIVELDELQAPASEPEPSRQPALAAVAESMETYRSDGPKASPHKAASANQLATIAKLSRLLGRPEEPGETMSAADASARITELSREYNERKGSGTRRSA